MNTHLSITEAEMLDSLKRSGYLLESEITSKLAGLGYFVEANQVIKDPVTGKSREIDLIAEHYNFRDDRIWDKTAAKIKFTFEIKNNAYPIVLLTELNYSPNLDLFDSLKIVETGNELTSVTEKIKFEDFIFPFEQYEANNIYTQYCSFQKKNNKDEIMATHPEEIHTGLMKITQYCEEWIEIWEQKKQDSEDINKFYRNFLFLPVLIIKDSLFKLNINQQDLSNPTLKEVEHAKLMFNYHHHDEPNHAIVYIVTKKGLDTFLASMRNIEETVEENMIIESRKYKKATNQQF